MERRDAEDIRAELTAIRKLLSTLIAAILARSPADDIQKDAVADIIEINQRMDRELHHRRTQNFNGF
jgi:hypothetical protein